MKKYFLLVLIVLTSLGVMAQEKAPQHHPQGNQPGQYDQQHHHGNQPAQNAAYSDGYRDGYRDGLRDQNKNNQHHHAQPTPAPAPAPVVANAEQSQWAMQILRKQTYDDKRMEVAKLCVVLCPFPVRDLKLMIREFTMEDNKVKFLEFAHRYCPDKENYYLFRDDLRYRSDYDKLMDSVQPGHRR